ncbi:hypothetical protein L7F22_025275 [Adiantum nelumboides]|nr:hypothetical protein [Adiantum nelumboides]
MREGPTNQEPRMEAEEGLQTQDDGMEQMLDAFFQPSEENANEAALEGVHLSPKDMLRNLARQLIYEGAKISVLHTCLPFLNLQSVYGWSYASVTALFRFSDATFRVPTGSKTWRHIENTWPHFKSEPRNLRLGMTMDVVNPFGLRSSSWSTWPVCLVNYNLPPWVAIKKGHLILGLIVTGKFKAKNMDFYLALVDELLELWDGMNIADAIGPARQQHARIHGLLMWTMHDWPGYGEAFGNGG